MQFSIAFKLRLLYDQLAGQINFKFYQLMCFLPRLGSSQQLRHASRPTTRLNLDLDISTNTSTLRTQNTARKD
jgi:hypothetical protein